MISGWLIDSNTLNGFMKPQSKGIHHKCEILYGLVEKQQVTSKSGFRSQRSIGIETECWFGWLYFWETGLHWILRGPNYILGFPGGTDSKESACHVGEPGSIPRSGRSPGEGEQQLTPAFLPRESHRQRLPGRLQSMGSQRVRHSWVTFTFNYVSGEQCTSGVEVMLMSTTALYPRWRSLAFGWGPPLWSSSKDTMYFWEATQNPVHPLVLKRKYAPTDPNPTTKMGQLTQKGIVSATGLEWSLRINLNT